MLMTRCMTLLFATHKIQVDVFIHLNSGGNTGLKFQWTIGVELQAKQPNVYRVPNSEE